MQAGEPLPWGQLAGADEVVQPGGSAAMEWPVGAPAPPGPEVSSTSGTGSTGGGGRGTVEDVAQAAQGEVKGSEARDQAPGTDAAPTDEGKGKGSKDDKGVEGEGGGAVSSGEDMGEGHTWGHRTVHDRSDAIVDRRVDPRVDPHTDVPADKHADLSFDQGVCVLPVLP